MIIVGIDPGIGRVGWGVIEEKKEKLLPLDFGCLETSTKLPPEKRLLAICQFLISLFKKYRPEAVSLEEIFFSANAKTAISVSQARGAIMLATAQNQISLFSYTPLEVKQALTGYGRADKKQIQYMVKTLLNLKELPKQDDAADALAIAITHAFSYKLEEKIQNSKLQITNKFK